MADPSPTPEGPNNDAAHAVGNFPPTSDYGGSRTVLDQMTEVESEVDGVYDGEVVTLDELQQLERELAKIRASNKKQVVEAEMFESWLEKYKMEQAALGEDPSIPKEESSETSTPTSSTSKRRSNIKSKGRKTTRRGRQSNLRNERARPLQAHEKVTIGVQRLNVVRQTIERQTASMKNELTEAVTLRDALLDEDQTLKVAMGDEQRFWHAQYERERDAQVADERYSTKGKLGGKRHVPMPAELVVKRSHDTNKVRQQRADKLYIGQQATKTNIKATVLKIKTINSSDGDGMTLTEFRLLQVYNTTFREKLGVVNCEMLGAKEDMSVAKRRQRQHRTKADEAERVNDGLAHQLDTVRGKLARAGEVSVANDEDCAKLRRANAALSKQISGYAAPGVMEYIAQKARIQQAQQDVKPFQTRVNTAEREFVRTKRAWRNALQLHREETQQFQMTQTFSLPRGQAAPRRGSGARSGFSTLAPMQAMAAHNAPAFGRKISMR